MKNNHIDTGYYYYKPLDIARRIKYDAEAVIEQHRLDRVNTHRTINLPLVGAFAIVDVIVLTAAIINLL